MYKPNNINAILHYAPKLLSREINTPIYLIVWLISILGSKFAEDY